MRKRCALAFLAFFHAGIAGAQVAPPVVGDLAGALSRIKNDVSTRAIARQFGDAYVRDWWNASDAVFADAQTQARYLSDQGPACTAIREREGDKSAAWATCSAGIDEAAKLLTADLSQIAAMLPDWERMARQIDAANATVTPLVDQALAAISETERRLAAKLY